MIKKLKSIMLIMCFAAMGLMTSCTKSNEDLIVGKWMLISETNMYDEMIGGVWEFTENGVFSINDTHGMRAGTYSIVDETTLYLTMYGSIKCTINQLDKKSMQFSYYDDGMGSFNFTRL